MKLLFPSPSKERADVAAVLTQRGFELVSDDLVTHGTHWTHWQRDEDAVSYVTRGAAGVAALKMIGPGEEELCAGLMKELPSRTDREILADAVGKSPRDRVKRSFVLGTIVWLESTLAHEAQTELFAMLLDEEPIVRWAAVNAVPQISRDLVTALSRAALRHPDLRGASVRTERACIAQEEGTLNDYDTDDRHELFRRARAGAADGQWKRVAKAMDQVLLDSTWDGDALHLRGLAYEAEGYVLEALFLLGAAEQKLVGSEEVRRKVDAEDDSDSDGDGDGDGDDDSDSDSDSDSDGDSDSDSDSDDDSDGDGDSDGVSTVEIEALRKRLPLLRERATTATKADRDRASEVVLRWLRVWGESSQTEALFGGARALRGRMPELEAALSFLEATYTNDEALLQEALTLAPDSPSVALALAHIAIERDEKEGLERCLTLREALRQQNELSPGARLVEEVVAARGERSVPTEATVVELLAQRAYDAKDYDKAAALGDELCALAPDTSIGWQLRANARIFGFRNEEAVVAYDEAIAALDKIYEKAELEGSFLFGKDPRPGMYFNRCCAQAKLGRKAEALESLRTAVLGDEKYAADAVEDDYLASLFEDPEFQAIVALEPKALRTREERTPEFVSRLIGIARDQQQAGDLATALPNAERAAELAMYIEDIALQVEALAVVGRMQAFSGSLDLALETTGRALELAANPTVPPAIRALAHAQRGICLQVADRLDEAEAAYQTAFEARRAAFGEDHPSLVKSLVSIAGVAAQRNAPSGEIEGFLSRGIDIAQRFLATSPPKDHLWAEAIDDLVSLLIRRALLRKARGAAVDAVQALSLATDRMEEQQSVGVAPMRAVLEQVRELASTLVDDAPSSEVSASAASVRDRIDDLLMPKEGRRTRLVFRALRSLVQGWRAGGVSDEKIASTLADFVRGGSALPEELRNISALADLRVVLAKAAAVEPVVLVTAAMSLSMAAVPGELDKAINQLEELMVPIAEDD